MKLRKTRYSPPLPAQTSPAVSVIIPLYNAEEYIGECLDSLLIQTFQDFEVIVVDDCSTDDSVAIVESYKEKFGGRLTFTKTEKNSGGGGYVPRNIGFNLSQGEYVYFVDADDSLLDSALETLYKAAKEYDAEVVYIAAHYQCKKKNEITILRDGNGKELAKKNLEDKTTLVLDEPSKNLHTLIFEKGFTTPWAHYVRRDFLNKHGISFPEIPKAGDYIWTIHVYCYAERFLRLPIPLYFYKIYNSNSVSQVKATTNEIPNWITAFVAFAKTMLRISQEIKILKENPFYCYEVLRRYFEWCLNRTNEAREKLSDEDIYEALQYFTEDYSNLMVPFFFSFINSERKIGNDRLKTIENLQKGIVPAKNFTVCPTVSIVIPLYNAEKYIGECLDSLLAQTFQDFEVIVVDDCSTDDSFAIVESYREKFGGRLTLAKMEKNTGCGSLPRNKGITLSRGEYICFIDNDDLLTPTALEELCTLAEKYDAEVVCCEKFYESDFDGTNIHTQSYQKDKFVDKPTLEPEDLKKRIQEIMKDNYSTVPWNKLVSRKLIIENNLFFAYLKISEDNIWNQGLLFYAKRYLRVPNIIYIYRLSRDSILRVEKTPEQKINFWLNPVLLGLKDLDNLMNKHEFFKTNHSLRFALLNKFIDTRFTWTKKWAEKLNAHDIYSAIKEEFGGKLGDYGILISALCTTLYEKKVNVEIPNKFLPYLTAKVLIRMNKKVEAENLQILSVSDKRAKLSKPQWWQKFGICHMISSYAGYLEVVAKATVDAQVQVMLSGLFALNAEDKSKRVPYWIDYTNLTVNGQKVFDELTPAWNDKSYRYTLDVKAGEEIKIQTEWLPHSSEAPKPVEQIDSKFLPYLTSRVDVKFLPQGEGDFQIVSMSDDKATVWNPAWMQKDGIGYQIQSCEGNLTLVAKATADGQIKLKFRSLDIRDPKDRLKRVPYWIDYTSLTINGQKVFDELTPTWHDKPYRYTFDVKAGEEITIQTEWLPHQSDNQTATTKKAKDIESLVNKDFLPYITGRLDIQLTAEKEGGDFQIVSVSDDNAKIKKSTWLTGNEMGYFIQSHVGKLNIIVKATVEGKIGLKLKAMDIRDPKDRSKRVPYWIDYTNLTINGQKVFDKLTPTWHNKPYNYTFYVEAGEEIKIQTEWLPHRSDN